MAIASAGCGLAQGKAVASATESLARNLAVRPGIQFALILGLVLIAGTVYSGDHIPQGKVTRDFRSLQKASAISGAFSSCQSEGASPNERYNISVRRVAPGGVNRTASIPECRSGTYAKK